MVEENFEIMTSVMPQIDLIFLLSDNYSFTIEENYETWPSEMHHIDSILLFSYMILLWLLFAQIFHFLIPT